MASKKFNNFQVLTLHRINQDTSVPLELGSGVTALKVNSYLSS